MIIDCHTHCFPPEVSADPAAWARIREEPHWVELVAPPGRPSIQGWATPGSMLQAMDAAGVETAVLLGWYWENESTCRWHSRVIAEWCAHAPERFLGFAAVLPNENVIEQLEAARELGLCGIGELHPGVQRFDSESAGWQALAAWCTRAGWPINFHATLPEGDHPKAVATPLEDYVAMVQQYPKLNFIFAHWGAGLPKRLENTESGNVYYDCSASPLLYDLSEFRRIIDLVGSDKVLFGSDYPLRLYPRLEKSAEMRRFIQEIRENAGLNEAALRRMFSENIRSLLRAHPSL